MGTLCIRNTNLEFHLPEYNLICVFSDGVSTLWSIKFLWKKSEA